MCNLGTCGTCSKCRSARVGEEVENLGVANLSAGVVYEVPVCGLLRKDTHVLERGKGKAHREVHILVVVADAPT